MTFRNAVARHAMENVQAYMKHFNIHEMEAYIASAFSYHGEIPFLYRVFQPTDVAELNPKQEPGGFKVVHYLVEFSMRPPYLPNHRPVMDFFGILLSSR